MEELICVVRDHFDTRGEAGIELRREGAAAMCGISGKILRRNTHL